MIRQVFNEPSKLASLCHRTQEYFQADAERGVGVVPRSLWGKGNTGIYIMQNTMVWGGGGKIAGEKKKN